MTSDLDELLHRFRNHDRRTLSRLLSWASRGEGLDRLREEFPPGQSGGRVIALSGSGGVGKSSLIARLVEGLRERDQTIAVLACDPQSPLTGGALLGDRIRISKPSADAGLFLRSLATPGGQQALANNLDVMIELLCRFGFQNVMIETVGAGQGDTAVRDVADVLVVLLQPETGDELQWEKAGLLEVADLIVVHKADLPGTDRVVAQIREQLNLPGCRPVPVLPISAQKAQGLDELWMAIDDLLPVQNALPKRSKENAERAPRESPVNVPR